MLEQVGWTRQGARARYAKRESLISQIRADVRTMEML